MLDYFFYVFPIMEIKMMREEGVVKIVKKKQTAQETVHNKAKLVIFRLSF